MKNVLNSLGNINFWNKKPNIDLGFYRLRYNKSIIDSIGNKLIKVIIGQRRAGKSYLVRQLIHHLIFDKKIKKENVFYLNKELYEFDNIRTANDLSKLIYAYESEYKPSGKVYIFIDEVQNIDDWEKLIVSLAQHTIKEYEVFITGSNSKLLSGELATLLSGRYITTEVFPFSYKEFLENSDLKNNKTNFIEYISTSGLPELLNLNSNDTKTNYFQSLKNTILLKDIMYRHKIRDYVLLEDLFLFVIHNVGSMISIPSIIKYFKNKNRKADYSTISQYLQYMQDAFIIHEAPRYFFKTKELLSGEKKYYVNDLGFRNYLYPSLVRDIGALLENIVFIHLRNAAYNIKIGYGRNYEIDFIAERNGEQHYVQVSYIMTNSPTINREFGAFDKVKDNLPKYVVTMDDILIKNENGIIHKNIWDYIYDLL
jgi:predicted AAA+ superfamily ATPase